MRDDGAVKASASRQGLYAKAMKYARQYAADTGRGTDNRELHRRFAARRRRFPCRWRQPESLPLCNLRNGEAGKPTGAREELPGRYG